MKSKGIQITDNEKDPTPWDLEIHPLRNKEGFIIKGIRVGNTLNQNQVIILRARAGEIKEYPTLGVGLSDIILGGDLLEMRRKIRLNLSSDGMRVKSLDLYNSRPFKLIASYE